MVEGKIEIFLSYKEPLFKERTLWLRPYLDKEGYELLYYGSNGWKPLTIHCNKNKIDKPGDCNQEEFILPDCNKPDNSCK